MTYAVKNNYRVLGLNNGVEAPLIWLIHGAGGDMHHFDTVVPVLIKSGFRVLLFDVRFHGLSQPQGEDQCAINQAPFDFQDVIEDIYTVIGQVKNKHYPNCTIQLYLGGLSMGGMISLLFAASNHHHNRTLFQLKGIILLAAGIPYLEVSRPGWEIFQTRQATPKMLKCARSAIIASSIKNPKHVKRAMDLVSDHAMYECLVAIASLLPAPSSSPTEYKLLAKVPMLLIMPDQDPYTKMEMEKLHEINLLHGVYSEAITITDAGHMVIIDQGPQVGACIRDFCLKKKK